MPRSRRNEMAATIPAEPEKDAFGLPIEPNGDGQASGNGAATATEEAPEPGEQGEMFPELQRDNPAHVALLKAAKKFTKEKAAREAQLKDNKSFVDGLMGKVVDAMHSCDLKKFKFGNISVELSTREKVVVKIDSDADEDEGDDE